MYHWARPATAAAAAATGVPSDEDYMPTNS